MESSRACILEKPISSLGESHLPARWIVNPFYDNLSSPHYLFLLDPQTHVTRSKKIIVKLWKTLLICLNKDVKREKEDLKTEQQ
jgi:hypothetical protein